MPRGREGQCTVCQNPSRLAIDQALLNGKSMRSVARDFRIGSTTAAGEFKPDHKMVSRHANGCISEAIEAAKGSRTEQAGQAILARLRYLDEQVDLAIEAAKLGDEVRDAEGQPVRDATGQPLRTPPNWRIVLAGVREGRRNAEVMALVAGKGEDQGDEDSLRKIREAQLNPLAREKLAELDELLAQDDQALEQQ